MKMVNPSAFIKGIRKQRKITQTELAEKSKVSQSNISKIENSLKGISLEDYEMILAALGFEIHIVERNDV